MTERRQRRLTVELTHSRQLRKLNFNRPSFNGRRFSYQSAVVAVTVTSVMSDCLDRSADQATGQDAHPTGVCSAKGGLQNMAQLCSKLTTSMRKRDNWGAQ